MNPELHIVLHEPEIPQNTGNIVRTCAALGAVLHLIEPLGFSLEDRYLKRAGLDYWPLLELQRHPGLEAFFELHPRESCFFVSKKADQTYADVEFPARAVFLFGKESLGLPESLLSAYPGRCIRIPMRREARSLNLSNAAAVIAYEYYRRLGFPGLEKSGGTGTMRP
jgi:tRNA (cytidine/uridine-2'-O-)-methyltransferase